MAKFEVNVVKIDDIEEHTNADTLEIAVVGGYRSIVKKKQFKKGDYAAYIPEQAILPGWLLYKMGLWDKEKGRGVLAGKNHNRVKAIRLRGELSQGLLYSDVQYSPHEHPLYNDVWVQIGLRHGKISVPYKEGKVDLAECLGIEKYVPHVPTTMSGDGFGAAGILFRSWDVESAQKFPIFVAGDDVVVTEKLHGTYAQYVYDPTADMVDGYEKHTTFASKGLAQKEIAFKYNAQNLKKNIYVKMFEAQLKPLWGILVALSKLKGTRIWILGEIYGKGIQDLHYGTESPEFRLFAVVFEDKKGKYYAPHDTVERVADMLEINTVPVLYRGEFHEEIIMDYRDGRTTLLGDHCREGVVVRKDTNRKIHTSEEVVFLKYVSPDYLLRKGNITEFD